MMDNDWGFVPRLIKEGEVVGFPKTEEPIEPPNVDPEELKRQVLVEETNGHPAYAEPEPDYEPIDTGIYS